MRRPSPALLFAFAVACASAGARPGSHPAAPPAPATEATISAERAQYPSTYARHPNPPVVIRNATILTATGQEIPNGSLVFKDG
ncbi:MAG TPA: hypothetical protein VH137_08350, partial [Gemmatimonadales bacterium]|nr:hypothetical protein [Gemmatimonadales bacterium]